MDISKIRKAIRGRKEFSGVVHIEEDGQVILHLAAGFANVGDQIPNRVDTAFGVASGTKGFTALGILRLVEKGQISLDERILARLPFEFPNISNDVTVRQLLSHTSGIYDYFDETVVDGFDQIFNKIPIQRILGPTDMLPLLTEGESYFQPGESFKYCNSAYVLLGIIIEAMSGESYDDYIQKEVCRPLGLERTGCYRSNRLPKNSAYGYIEDAKGDLYSNIFDIPIACTADGGLYSNANDIAKMWKGIFGGSFLSSVLVKEAFRPQSARPDYGLGFWLQKSKKIGSIRYSLVGADPGVSFVSSYDLSCKRIITILGNTSDQAELLFDEILSLYE